MLAEMLLGTKILSIACVKEKSENKAGLMHGFGNFEQITHLLFKPAVEVADKSAKLISCCQVPPPRCPRDHLKSYVGSLLTRLDGK